MPNTININKYWGQTLKKEIDKFPPIITMKGWW